MRYDVRYLAVIAFLLLLAVVGYTQIDPRLLNQSNDPARLSMIEGEVGDSTGGDSGTVIGVVDPETDEQVGEIRWEQMAYRFTLRNEGGATLKGLDIRIIPSDAIVRLYDGTDPFNDDGGGRVNYGNLPQMITIDPGATIEIERTITTFAHETEHTTDVESPLTPEETERLKEIATENVVLQVGWHNGSQSFPLDRTLDALD